MSGADRLGGRKTLKVGEFLSQWETDGLKRRVEITELFASFGISLSAKGNSHVGRCPWHEDSSPSLSVDAEKGLYHCFGCGESGDVLTLVRKMKGVGFPEAVKWLEEWSGEHGKSSPAAAPVDTTARAAEPADEKAASPAEGPSQSASSPSPADSPPAADTHGDLSLDVPAEHYAGSLSTNRAALQYLAKRGLTDLALVRRLGTGFADGSLLKLASNGQAESLKALGILSKAGREHFGGCLVFPLHDERGEISGFYGRVVSTRRKIHHLYLSGPHRGLFNRKAATVYEELLVTESVIDAVSLMQLGYENTQALYGAEGLGEEHITCWRDERVGSIVLALDADDAGRQAAAKHRERLVSEGFAVKTIEPPNGKDWNEYLVGGGTRQEIAALLEEAETASPQKTGLSVKRSGGRYIVLSGSVRYRVLGVRPAFVASLRVNIRAEKVEGEAVYLDNVDLYSARSRSAFAAAAAQVLSSQAERIERDLLALVDHLEGERDAALSVSSDSPRELSIREREAGMELLGSSDLFDRIVGDMEALGYVGERTSKELLYLAASSRKTDYPISVLILSASASGKSLLVETVRRLMPPEDVVAVTSLSDQALNYLPEGGLLHKFLILGEAVHSEVVEHQIREMLSSGELSRLVTTKDAKTGELLARTVRSPVVVSAVMSSTADAINPENASRAFLIHADESREQTQAIHAAQRGKYSLQRQKAREEEIPRIIERHQAAQRLLVPRIVVNPYAHHLSFPDTLMRTRRDHERFMDLIAAVCLLRQYQKEERTNGDPVTGESSRYIECDLVDYQVAYRIIAATLPATLSSFPEGAGRLYEAVRALIKEKAKAQELSPAEVSVTQREIREASGLSQMFVKRYTATLSEWEYLRVSGSGYRGSRYGYRLAADRPIELVDLSMIPTPEELEERIAGG